jgi:hypothetical protein
MDIVTTKPARLAVRAGMCLSCGQEPIPLAIDIVSANARENAWELKGVGSFGFHCPRCAAQLRSVEMAIPIHCVGLECPKCKKPEHLTVQVKSLTMDGNEVEFTANLECAACQRTTGFKEVLKKIAGLLSIEIGITGISIKAREKGKGD